MTRLDNVLITHGSQQELDLSGKVLLDDADIVICESPTYLAAISAFKSYGCSFVEIPTDGEGMNMAALEDVINTTENIKLILCYTNLSKFLMIHIICTLQIYKKLHLFPLLVLRIGKTDA